MGKVIRDPIHNIIEVEDDVLELIDTYAFQRLRRIRQLGVAWLVYPSAEHSRFTHSLGVYEMSKRVIQALKRNSSHFTLHEDEEKLITTAALLHDIGHGPFSHMLEGAIKNLGGHFEHEEMSTRIILVYPEINARLQRFGTDFPARVCQVLQNKYPSTHVASVISSQFDADRIDYLLRDSYMTGANYGKFDVDWLLRNISIETATFTPVKGQTVVGINHKKGLNVLEQYLLGRHYMYIHVYYHKVIRSFEAIVNNLIKRILEKEHKKLAGYKVIEALFNSTISIEDYLQLDDFVMMSWFNEWYTCNKAKDPVLRKLLEYFFCRVPFKVILPPQEPIAYNKKKEEVLKQYFSDDEKKYFFYEDSSQNVAYKDLYNARDVLDEIFVCKEEDEIVPLSALDDSIIKQASKTLKKDTIRWYIKPE